jgi:gentisate 1,2-dioxygenase
MPEQATGARARSAPESRHPMPTEYTKRAVYYVPVNSFKERYSDVPVHLFAEERDAALAPKTGTRVINLDLGPSMGLSYPATLPNVLAKYIKIPPGGSLQTRFRASAEIFYVLTGDGHSANADDVIEWGDGDVVLLPGGQETTHKAGAGGALLFAATDEPMLCYAGTVPPSARENPISAVRYCAGEIEEQLGRAHARPDHKDEASKAVVFTSEPMKGLRTTSPWITANINTLEAGADQRAHRHNAAAITLCIEGQDVHSMIDGRRIDWQPFAAMTTPPAALHSHHNRGRKRMSSFVVQDSGIYYYSRTVGFSFDE